MADVPNRAGTHRALAHDYSRMSNEQLKGVHAQAVANPQIPKYAKRIQPTMEEMANRKMNEPHVPSAYQKQRSSQGPDHVSGSMHGTPNYKR
jgi:hypothetical protein